MINRLLLAHGFAAHVMLGVDRMVQNIYNKSKIKGMGRMAARQLHTIVMEYNVKREVA